MRLLPAALLIIAGLSLAAIADEPIDESSKNGPTVEQLLERIEKLERRVAALESEPPRRFAPPPGSRLPRDRRFQPLPPDRAPARRLPPDEEGVPENWQRFEFNGQYFYIIPVDEVARRTGPRD